MLVEQEIKETRSEKRKVRKKEHGIIEDEILQLQNQWLPGRVSFGVGWGDFYD